ncbi:vesicular integral-membrane protein VIP36-like [Xenia sp. Carnegie-2017]|uniref:vesicular integral-membrane protein VIP36-like n=1 Tax=Xenia sp. Carnegie-2017 TaxID=2897299 RepID=UPI001F047B53|nr:vesicular integral-membrane protein VIP36-like [Xenia sp. Carnegie-2017]
MTDIDSDGEWKACLQVSGIRLPTSYFIGLSAATGNLADNHDIVGLKFYELEVEKDEQTVRSTENTDDIVPFVKAEPVKEPVENSPKGHYTRRMTKAFTWFFWILVVGVMFVWSDFCIQEATGGCTQTIFNEMNKYLSASLKICNLYTKCLKTDGGMSILPECISIFTQNG